MTLDNDKKPGEETQAAESHHSTEKLLVQTGSASASETTQPLHERLLQQIEQEAQFEENMHSLQAEMKVALAVEIARYTDLYDAAPVGYFTLTHNGTIVQANLTGASQLGWERERLAGARFGLFVAETDLPHLNSCLNQTFTTSSKQTCELTLAQQNQSPVIVLFEAIPSSTLTQECRVVTTDITALKQTEKILYERLKEITCLYSIRRDMELDSPLEKICQRIFVHLITSMQHPENASVAIEFDDERYTSTRYSYGLTHKLCTPLTLNGENRGQLQVFYDEDKPFLLPEEQHLIDAIATDLQWWLERKQAADVLKAAQEKTLTIEKALDASSIVAITDRRGVITYANDKFCTISKYSREELLGQDHRIINSGLHSKEFFRELWTTIAHGHIWKGEVRNRAKDGSFYWMDTTIVPFFDMAGKPYQYVSIRKEITRRKRMEEMMKQQLDELARSNAELGQFAYVATHDLQEPLRSVTGCVQLLKKRYEGQLDERADEFISHAVAGTKRMQMLIDDLLAYSQINADQPHVPIDCTALLNNVLINLTITIAESGALITHGVLPKLRGNPSQLMQIFQNLISNALKFHGVQPPRIHVDAVAKGDMWQFSVADNGIGMEAQYSERIFRVFQRLHTRTEYPGTGIGLAICKKVAEYHGGRIWVESQPGQGSIFYFTITKKE